MKEPFLEDESKYTDLYKLQVGTISRETAENDDYKIFGGEQFVVGAVEFENDEWMWRVQDRDCDPKRVF